MAFPANLFNTTPDLAVAVHSLLQICLRLLAPAALDEIIGLNLELDVGCYGAIDLHSNNDVTVLIDEQDQVVYQKRLPNDLVLIARSSQASGRAPRHCRGVDLQLVLAGRRPDGPGTSVHLANIAAIQQSEGLKYTDDTSG